MPKTERSRVAPSKGTASKKGPGKKVKKPAVERTFDARPDTLDFRDRMFVPTLVEVPVRISLDDYLKCKVPILDQGEEGACTGFGLATMVHYLLRKRRVVRDAVPVSPWMLYEMARRYDEWPGEDYEGSSARGAMKGWHKHGVCAHDVFKNFTDAPGRKLTPERLRDALRRPLGAYYRVNHKDLIAMHSAIAEVGVLYATATVHAGWSDVGKDGLVHPSGEILGGHAFAIVAFDEIGFWVQNSWGPDWGHKGFCQVTYDDWLKNGTDVWVARLGAPVVLEEAASAAVSLSAAAGRSQAYAFRDVRPHIVAIGNDGKLRTHGAYGTAAADVESIFAEQIPAATAKWKTKRILLYAHGGLTSEESAVQHVADYRSALLGAEVYPVAFIWKTDYWTTLTNILQDAVRSRRPEGFLDASKDFMLNRLDDALEPIARFVTGKAEWSEMKENAILATKAQDGGARFVAEQLAKLVSNGDYEIHVLNHSAGSIFFAPLVQMLAAKGTIPAGPLKGEQGLGIPIRTCTLWAPACTIDLFRETYRPLVENGSIAHFALFTLTDDAEQDDNCAGIYHKSLLYLVSNAFEERFHMPGFPKHSGEPILGLEKWVKLPASKGGLMDFFGDRAEWVRAPNQEPAGSSRRSTARHHGDFDDDTPTLQAALARILARQTVKAAFAFHGSASALRDRRQGVDLRSAPLLR
jgi:Papain family cysteine protease